MPASERPLYTSFAWAYDLVVASSAAPQPDELARLLAGRKTIVDVGCGTGRHAGYLAGAGFAMVLALLTAAPIVRLTGVAAGIATLAILVIIHEFDYQTSAVTRGTSTQIGVPTTTTLLSTLVWALIVVGAAFAFQQSRFGLRLRATARD